MTERYSSLERLLSDMALEPPSDSVAGALAVQSYLILFLNAATVAGARSCSNRTVNVNYRKK